MTVTDAERREHIDSVIKVFQRLILNAKTPTDKLKFTLSMDLYQATESVIWDLNFTDKYGENMPRFQLFEILVNCYADSLLPFITSTELPKNYSILTKVLGEVFAARLDRGIRNDSVIHDKLTEEQVLNLMKDFTDDSNRASKPSPR
jgi:hypothetical protein